MQQLEIGKEYNGKFYRKRGNYIKAIINAGDKETLKKIIKS